MQIRRRQVLGAKFATVLLLGILATPTVATAVEPAVIRDGGFEAAAWAPATGLDSPHWVEHDSEFISPLCATSGGGSCSVSSSIAPRTGSHWVWFGGANVANHTASLTQTIAIPSGSGIALTYWYRRVSGAAPYDATLTVTVDGDILQTLTEPTDPDAAYTLGTVDVSAYADDETHELSFTYADPAGGSYSIGLDDVEVTLPARAAAPTITSPDPLSIHWSTETTVQIAGTSEPGTAVEIYNRDDFCTGTPIGTGTAAEFAAGITVEVPPNSFNQIAARTVKPGFLSSYCSQELILYNNDQVAPEPPQELSVAPASPGQATSVVVRGAFPNDTGTIRLYSTADCAGPPVASGTNNEFDDPGFSVTVAKGSTTTWHADAVDRAGNISVCSTDSATYTHLDPISPSPNTAFTKTPAKKVFTKKGKKKVKFQFTSSIAGSTFLCSVDGKAARPCTSPLTFKAKLGKHTVAVTATAGALSDPTPATYTFKVKKKPKK